MNLHTFHIPGEHELIEFFGSEPTERVVEDGYWCYQVNGPEGTTLRFSLNLYERSVQTELLIGASSITVTSHEMASQLAVHGSQLRCEFRCIDCRTTLTINAAHHYTAVWSTLRME